MPIGIGEDHEELRARCGAGSRRAARPGAAALLDAETETLPPFWDELAAQGWLGIHVAEEYGGQGFGMLELAVVVEEMARAVMPGPAVPTMLAAAVVAAGADDAQRKALLPPLVDGTVPAAVALPGAGVLTGAPGRRRHADGARRAVGPVLGATLVAALLAPVTVDGAGAGGVWSTSTTPTGSPPPPWPASTPPGGWRRCRWTGPAVRPRAPAARRDERHWCATWRSSWPRRSAPAGRGWCLESAPTTPTSAGSSAGPSASSRRSSTAWPTCWWRSSRPPRWPGTRPRPPTPGTPAQAGCRPCWPGPSPSTPTSSAPRAASRSSAAWASPGSTTPTSTCGGPCRCASSSARARALRVEASRAAAGRQPAPARARAPRGRRARPGARSGAVVAEVAAAPDSGRAAPAAGRRPGCSPRTGPRRGAGGGARRAARHRRGARRPPHVHRPHLAVGAWALPTIIAHGTAEQQERWVGPTLRGELVWCQLFSEPGAGSDLAALSTRATRATAAGCSTARRCGRRSPCAPTGASAWPAPTPTPPSTRASPTSSSTCTATASRCGRCARSPATAMFNEVFFTDVFVPDDCVVGPVNGGWRLARTTLANERVSMASGATFGFGIEGILRSLAADGARGRRGPRPASGALLAEAQSVALLGARTTLRSVSGVEPGPEASVRKLLGAEHEQRVQELGLVLLGARGATTEGDAGRWSQGLPLHPVPDHRRGHERGAAQRHRRAHPRACPATPSPGTERRRQVGHHGLTASRHRRPSCGDGTRRDGHG